MSHDSSPSTRMLTSTWCASTPPSGRGGDGAGSIGQLPQRQRFHWLVAPRSTVIQPSPVHTGRCGDPAAALEHLVSTMVDSTRDTTPTDNRSHEETREELERPGKPAILS